MEDNGGVFAFVMALVALVFVFGLVVGTALAGNSLDNVCESAGFEHGYKVNNEFFCVSYTPEPVIFALSEAGKCSP